MTINFPVGPQQGWQCPVCKTVMAPWAPMCLGCKAAPKASTVSSTQIFQSFNGRTSDQNPIPEDSV